MFKADSSTNSKVEAYLEENEQVAVEGSTGTYEILESQDPILSDQVSLSESITNEDVLTIDDEVPGQTKIHFNLWDIMKKSAINLILPFINGVMLGFGEILAHEIGFRYNWIGARVVPQIRHEQREESKYL